MLTTGGRRHLAAVPPANAAPERLFLSVAEVARMMECDPRTVRAGCAAGTIPSVRIGNTIRIPAALFYAQVAGLPTDGGDVA